MSVYFYYPVARTLTGQEMASRLILKLLRGQFAFDVRKIPAFDRRSSDVFYHLKYAIHLLSHWFSVFKLFFVVRPVVYLNMGQTIVSLMRDGFPIAVLRKLKPSCRCVISLHGHMFTTWAADAFKAKLFLAVLRQADCVTVLGDVQKTKLIGFGLESEKVRVVNNTCEFESAGVRDAPTKGIDRVNILYLSYLIESKGYRQYLGALKCLAAKPKPNVQAILCGRLDVSTVVDDAASVSSQENWIIETIKSINASDNVSVEWLKGADGEGKRDLFEAADVFVFPSQHEAQPIVLIEAMAARCAIITSAVGEIPSTVGSQCAIVLSECSAVNIAKAIQEVSAEKIEIMKQASVERFASQFSNESYANTWERIFSRLGAKAAG